MTEDVGIRVVNTMSYVEAAAMWVEANVSYRAAHVILRHLHAKFSFHVQVPLSQIAILSYAVPSLNPVFHQFQYKKKVRRERLVKK